MTEKEVLARTVEYVKAELAGAEGGHDWWHIERVWNNTRHLLQTENADPLIAQLGALLHDIADAKFHDGDERIGPRKTGQFLRAMGVAEEIVTHVENIVRHISFKGGNFESSFQSLELDLVQDADRLDAMGAIGIARAFNYGGFKGRALYDPAVAPVLNMSKEDYKNSTAPTINHFYEKLLLLRDRMNTETGKKMAWERHQFMEEYLKQFYKEWNGA